MTSPQPLDPWFFSMKDLLVDLKTRFQSIREVFNSHLASFSPVNIYLVNSEYDYIVGPFPDPSVIPLSNSEWECIRESRDISIVFTRNVNFFVDTHNFDDYEVGIYDLNFSSLYPEFIYYIYEILGVVTSKDLFNVRSYIVDVLGLDPDLSISELKTDDENLLDQ